MSKLPFSTLALPTAQLNNLDRLGYLQMTPIQAQALPLALAGQDIIAQAKTGSGKTAAFALPLLNKLNPRDFGAQALVLCPTRELATQVAGEIRRLARYQQNIKVVVLCGGQSIGPQIGSLEHGAHVIVGTPGRIKDHLRKKTLSLSRINSLVLDEADRMLDMGFIDDITSIIEQTPANRQTLLFSATFPQEIQTTSTRFQKSAQHVKVESLHDDQHISQQFFICHKREKLEGLVTLLNHNCPKTAVVFCNTIQKTHEVRSYLIKNNFSAIALHGDLEQRDRDQTLIQFKHHSCNVLVATDVAARGLDIDDLPMVVNFDLPRDPEIYVHRIGRTGRAGKEGLALSLLSDTEVYKLDSIGEYQQRAFSLVEIETLKTMETLPANHKTMPQPAFDTLCISGGRRDKVRPGDILGALTADTRIDSKAVGKIDVMDYAAYVAVERKVSGKALEQLTKGKIKGRKFKVRKL